VSGYIASPSSGKITVSNESVTQVITFTTGQKPTSIELYGMVAVVILIIVLPVLLFIITRKR